MTASSKDIKVTLIGSFKKDREKLTSLFNFLNERYTLLSPSSIDWQNKAEDFVKASEDENLSVEEIENRHLEAIRNSDFVILHAPEGYVGLSGAYELGFANALGVPVITQEPLQDVMLTKLIPENVQDIESLDLATIDLGRGLKYLQNYYHRTAARRGWGEETARDTMLLLTEEIGELARAIRKHEGLSRDGEYDVQLAEELADVQLYLVHLANNVQVDIADAVTAKDIKNATK